MKNVPMDRAVGSGRAGEAMAAPWREVVLACALLAAAAGAAAQGAAQPGAAAGADPIRLLIQQSQYWQSRGDGARAKENWERLLRVSPGQPEALVGLAQLALDEDQPDVARDYLRQLQSAHPGSPLIATLEQSIRVGGNRQQLEAARALAQQGRASEAAAQYRQALGGQVPTGDLALEYYQTLGGSAEGWDEARRGLEKLASEDPGNAGKALALAQHLTYRENTRAEGLRRLAELAGRPEVAQDVRQSWRRALPWLGSGNAAVAGYQGYLRQYPDDAQAQAGLEALRSQQRAQADAAAQARDPLRERSTAGFRALDGGDAAAAERDFQAVLAARPGDADAQGGLGLVRLRQERFEDARRLLQQASRGGHAARWRSALDSATYWSLVRQADAERAARNWPQAQRLLEQAVAIDAGEPAGRNALAEALAAGGQLGAAEAAYRDVLQRQPGNADATRGLIGVLARGNRTEEALRLYEGLGADQQKLVGPVGALRAQRDIARAQQARASGDAEAERAALERAMSNDPTSPWVRLDLARLYLQMGAPAQAGELMRGLIASGQASPDALYAAALLAGEMADWGGALALLEQIPGSRRTPDMGNLQRRAWVHAQAAQGQALIQQARVPEGLGLLGQARAFTGQDPELLGVVAGAYADAGQPGQAIDVLRQAIAATVRPQPALWLQYAGILLKTGQDAELSSILQQLASQPLNAEDERAYQGLRVSFVVRQADALREAGDLAGAYDVLAPLLVELPGNGEVIGALARMHADHGDYPQALALYTRQRQQNPRDLPTLLGAASTAVQAKEYGYAESALATALAVAPRDPQVLAAAARLYRAQGKSSKAVEYYNAAIAAEQGQANPFGAPPVAAQVSWNDARPRNPFRAAGPAAAPAGRPGPVNPFAQVAGRVPAPGVPRAAPALPAYGAAPAAQQGVPMSLPWTATRSAAAASAYAPAPKHASAGVARNTAPQPAAASAVYAGAPAGGAYVPYPSAAGSAVSAPAGGYPVQGHAANGYPAPAYPASASPVPAYPAGVPPLAAPAGTYDAFDGRTVAAAGPQPPRTLSEELSELRQERGATFTVGSTLRTRKGESGLGKLDDVEVPFDVNVPLGNGKVTFNATLVSLDAGDPATTTSLASYDAGSRFGAGPVAAYDSYLSAESGDGGRTAGSQSDDGVGVSVGYEGERWRADIGTTPIGFRYSSVVGGAQVNGPLTEQLNYKLGVARRAVTDSLLSFAGTQDARSGDEWGGVVATGVRAELGLQPEQGYGFYGYGSYHRVSGHNVASNTRFEGGGGMYYQLIDEPDHALSSGLALTLLGFGKNRRYFTYGHGGYFSPQNFMSVSVPLDWSQRTSRLSYRLQGSLGVQHFKEDPANYFPTSRARQAAAYEAAQIASGQASLSDDAARARYSGQSKTGLGYNLSGSLEYKVAPQLFLGGVLGLDNASDYRQMTGGVYLRYALEPQSRPMAMPLAPYRSPYSVY